MNIQVTIKYWPHDKINNNKKFYEINGPKLLPLWGLLHRSMFKANTVSNSHYNACFDHYNWIYVFIS